MKEPVFQSTFVGGELSPHMQDRIDIEIYSAGAARLRNFIPLPHGPIMRRQGSQYLATANAAVKFIPFSFSVEQSFMLEFSHLKMRVYYQDLIVLGQDGVTPFELVTPWRDIDLPNLCWAQYKDGMYIVDGYHEPYVLERHANNDWRLQMVGDAVYPWVNKPIEFGGTNWPAFVTFFEQRLIYAGTPAQPQQLWFSRTGLPEDFTYNDGEDSNGAIIVLDDHAMTYTIFSTDANGIKWVEPGASLLIGTSGGEYRVGSTVFGDAITPKNIKIVPQTYFGSAPVTPVKVDAAIVFVPRSRTRIKSVEYSLQQEQFLTQDMTVFASHIFQGKVKELAFQTAPDTYIWAITEDGKLVGCTYEKNQKVMAWHMHETDGLYKSIGISPSDGNDFIYVCVERGGKYFVELLTNLTEPPEPIDDGWYVDAALKYEGEPVNRLVGLTHLIGKRVNVLADGWVHPPVIVDAAGGITLNSAASRVQVGLPYTSDYVSLIPQSQQSLTVGIKRRISEIVVALENSLDFWFRAVGRDRSENAYAGPTPIMNLAKAPFSGHRKLQLDSNSEISQQLQIWTDRPIPLIIRGIVFYINPVGI